MLIEASIVQLLAAVLLSGSTSRFLVFLFWSVIYRPDLLCQKKLDFVPPYKYQHPVQVS